MTGPFKGLGGNRARAAARPSLYSPSPLPDCGRHSDRREESHPRWMNRFNGRAYNEGSLSANKEFLVGNFEGKNHIILGR